MVEHREHDLALRLFQLVATHLEGEEQEDLLAERRLIGELLALGVEPTPSQIAAWVRDAD